ncbi:MAG: energy transducer TonB [Bacteroidota bacterium]
MKQIFFIVIIAVVLSGCESKDDGIEIIPDYDAVYFTDQDVDSPAKPMLEEDSQKELENVFKEFYDEKLGRAQLFKVAFRIYINENGVIDKLKILDESSYKFGTTGEDGILFFDNQKLYPRIKEMLSKYEFEPAKKGKDNVKYRKDIAYACSILPGGKVKGYIPLDFSLDFSSLNPDNFFVVVDQTPEPIGGMEAIMKNVKYPEIAKRAGIQGKVYIKAYINEEGNVVRTEVIKSADKILDSAAANAVIKTKFNPGKQKGESVKTQVVVPIVFKLK